MGDTSGLRRSITVSGKHDPLGNCEQLIFLALFFRFAKQIHASSCSTGCPPKIDLHDRLLYYCGGAPVLARMVHHIDIDRRKFIVGKATRNREPAPSG
ncbi:hypothetical protein NHH03_09635 [Stieleria sp. TO1_6]|nr:hypothetical protein [Stieleria tagensis]